MRRHVGRFHQVLGVGVLLCGWLCFVGCGSEGGTVQVDVGTDAGGGIDIPTGQPDELSPPPDEVTPPPPVCDPSTDLPRCDGKRRVFCLEDGTNWDYEECPLGCALSEGAAVCVDQICEPHVQECLAGDLRTFRRCRPDGKAWQVYSCPAPLTCADGTCVAPPPCTDGERACEGESYLKVCIEQAWSYSRCPFGCADNACKDALCEPFSTLCHPSEERLIVQCNNTGTGFTVVGDCEDRCVNAQCQDRACAPGSTRCSGTSVQRCNEAGTGFINIDYCSHPCIMDQNVARCPVCTQGARFCEQGNMTVRECTNPAAATPEAGFTITETCGGATHCVVGHCVETLDLAGAPLRRDELMLIAQGFVDCWRANYGSPTKVLCYTLDTVVLWDPIDTTTFFEGFVCSADPPTAADYRDGANDVTKANDIFACNGVGRDVRFLATVESGWEDRYCIWYDPSFFDAVVLDLCANF